MFDPFENLGKSLVIGLCMGLAATLVALYCFSDKIDAQTKASNLKIYNQYKDCKVMEVDHYNGFFEANTNKLNCNGTIYNVNKSDYDEVMNNH